MLCVRFKGGIDRSLLVLKIFNRLFSTPCKFVQGLGKHCADLYVMLDLICLFYDSSERRNKFGEYHCISSKFEPNCLCNLRS